MRTRGQPLFSSLEDDFCWGKLVGGGIEVAFLSGFAGDYGPGHQVTMLVLWRFYTTILLTISGMYLLIRTHGAAAAKELFTVGWFRRR